MDRGRAVSATVVGSASRVLSSQECRLLHQQYKNAASIYCLNRGTKEAGEKISPLVTIKNMLSMGCKAMGMMGVVS